MGIATGLISNTQGDFIDYYALNLAIGDEITVRVERTAGNWSGGPATWLSDSEGHSLGNGYFGSGTEASFTTDILTITGSYYLGVQAHSGSGTYRLTVSR